MANHIKTTGKSTYEQDLEAHSYECGGSYQDNATGQLFRACERLDFDAVEAAFAAGADANAGGTLGDDPPLVVVYTQTFLRSNDHDVGMKIIRLLVAKGANVNVTSGAYPALLTDAVSWDLKDLVRLLLDNGAEPNGMIDGEPCITSVMVAAADNSTPDMLDMLLAAGADVNKMMSERAEDTCYPSAMHWLIKYGDANYKLMAQRLIDAGHDLTLVNCWGWTLTEFEERVLDSRKERVIGRHLAATNPSEAH